MDKELLLKENQANQNTINQLDSNGWIIKPQKNINPNDYFIEILDTHGNRQAASTVSPAEESNFQTMTRMPKSSLNNSISVNGLWISPDQAISTMLPPILYFSLRRGRIWNKSNVVALIPTPNPEAPLATLMKLERLNHIADIDIENQKFLPLAQQVKYSMYYLYQQCSGVELKLIQDNFLNEILEIHRNWLNRFYEGPWCQAILNETLTREQYIASLFNLHEYVRYTTRLAARAVAHSDDIRIRNQYLNHLKGEINHELIIESDLKHLGADIEYLKNAHTPSPGTKEFMVVQESTIGFYQDPVLMFACPLAAEGASAHMSPDFLKQLEHLIGSWGVKEPRKAMYFLASHIHTDGGEEGHWNNVVKIMQEYINSEKIQQKFLSVLIAAMNGFEHGFNANIEEMKLWAAISERELQNV